MAESRGTQVAQHEEQIGRVSLWLQRERFMINAFLLSDPSQC